MKGKLKKITLKKGLFFFVIVFLAIYAVLIYTFYTFKQGFEKPADAAIVLGAAVIDEVPSPVFQARIDYAITLLQKGKVDKIIFTGGIGKGDHLSEAMSAKNYALSKGISSSKLLIEEKSKTTFQNLKYAYQLGKQNGFESYALISDPIHLKRSLALAKQFDATFFPAGTPYTRYQSFSTKFRFANQELLFYIKHVCFKLTPTAVARL